MSKERSHTYWYIITPKEPSEMDVKLKMLLLREYFYYPNVEGGFTYMLRFHRTVSRYYVYRHTFEKEIYPCGMNDYKDMLMYSYINKQ